VRIRAPAPQLIRVLGRQRESGGAAVRIEGKSIGIAVVGLLVGAVAGGALGFEMASRIWHRMSKPLIAATGSQAYNVLTLLDGNEEGKAREFLELEVDSTLLSLRVMEANEPFASGDPTSLVYKRLREYRTAHPRAASLTKN
jgi:hypothetical protein